MMHVDMFEVRIKEERTVGGSYINIVFTDLVKVKMRVIVVTSIWPFFFNLKAVCNPHISKIYSFFIRHISSRACVDFSYFLIALYKRIFVL